MASVVRVGGMTDFSEKENFARTVYTVDVQARKVVPHRLGDLCEECAAMTATPWGSSTTLHVRGAELWTWGDGREPPARLDGFKTEAEAHHALMLCFRSDLQSRHEFFSSRRDAELALAEELNG